MENRLNELLPHPSLTAPTLDGKMEQLNSYLYNLIDQLNYILQQQEVRNDGR